MNLRLEELRRRLLEPAALPKNGKTVYQRSSAPSHSRRESSEVIEVAIAEASRAMDSTEHLPAPFAEPIAVPESVTAAVLQYVQQNTGEEEAHEVPSEVGQYQLAQAVGKVFEQTRAFEETLTGLRSMLDPMKQAGASLSRSIEPLRSLERQIQDLAQAFDSIRSFQSQLAQLAESFEPMRCLEQQVVQFSEAVGVHLNRLNRSLDAARIFKGELVALVRSLEPVEEMQGRFINLIGACGAKPVLS
jgi:prefoldin subunit 5